METLPTDLQKIVLEKRRELHLAECMKACHVRIRNLYDLWMTRTEYTGMLGKRRFCLDQKCGHFECEQHDLSAFMLFYFRRPRKMIVKRPGCIVCSLLRKRCFKCPKWKRRRSVDYFDGTCERVRKVFETLDAQH